MKSGSRYRIMRIHFRLAGIRVSGIKRNKSARLAIFIFYGLLLTYGLFRSASPPSPFSGSDKLLHIAAFGGFALLAALAFTRLPRWLLWVLLCLLAPASELLQNWLYPETRVFSWADILANWTGIALAGIFLLVWNYRKSPPP
ncbi:hypothetical protein [Thiopseudomonas denitrificans]|uniref:hypothetical protein n=1 Tax=Thiopseudomonas denitrificans TaxID=1501432 RepID=UPI00105D3A3D|nr:hypothetical protein [Thiopseudomonas denitrificans]